jgi:hypothetical protein
LLKQETIGMNSVSGRRNQAGFFAAGLGLALFAAFAAAGWGLVTVVEEQPGMAAGPEVQAHATAASPAESPAE